MPERALVTPRKQPKQARARATVEALLEAAARVLVEEGHERTTTARIAEVAGVGIGSLYEYFPSKDALIAALVERHEQSMLEQLSRMAEELQGLSLEDGVRTYVAAMLAVHARGHALHQILTQQLAHLLGFEEIRKMQVRAEGVVRGYLQAHRARLRCESLDVAAFILVTAVESVTHAAILDRPEMLRDPSFAEEVSQLVLRYLLR